MLLRIKSGTKRAHESSEKFYTVFGFWLIYISTVNSSPPSQVVWSWSKPIFLSRLLHFEDEASFTSTTATFCKWEEYFSSPSPSPFLLEMGLLLSCMLTVVMQIKVFWGQKWWGNKPKGQQFHFMDMIAEIGRPVLVVVTPKMSQCICSLNSS